MTTPARLSYPQSDPRTGSVASEFPRFWCLAIATRAATVAVAAALAACATVAQAPADGPTVRHYFGYVRVAIPAPEAGRPVRASDVALFGLRVSDGVSLGYLRDKSVVVPLDCRLVVLVATAKQLGDAMQKLSLLKDAPGICAAVSPTLQTGDTP